MEAFNRDSIMDFRSEKKRSFFRSEGQALAHARHLAISFAIIAAFEIWGNWLQNLRFNPLSICNFQYLDSIARAS